MADIRDDHVSKMIRPYRRDWKNGCQNICRKLEQRNEIGGEEDLERIGERGGDKEIKLGINLSED